MKKKILIILCILLYAQGLIAQSEVFIKLSKPLDQVLTNYIKKISLLGINDKVLRVDFRNNNDEETFVVNYLSLTKEIKKPPLVYFKYDNYIILLYTGIENYTSSDNFEFNKTMKLFLEDNPVKEENPIDQIAKSTIKDNFLLYKYSVKKGELIQIENTKEYLFDL